MVIPQKSHKIRKGGGRGERMEDERVNAGEEKRDQGVVLLPSLLHFSQDHHHLLWDPSILVLSCLISGIISCQVKRLRKEPRFEDVRVKRKNDENKST